MHQSIQFVPPKPMTRIKMWEWRWSIFDLWSTISMGPPFVKSYLQPVLFHRKLWYQNEQLRHLFNFAIIPSSSIFLSYINIWQKSKYNIHIVKLCHVPSRLSVLPLNPSTLTLTRLHGILTCYTRTSWDEWRVSSVNSTGRTFCTLACDPCSSDNTWNDILYYKIQSVCVFVLFVCPDWAPKPYLLRSWSFYRWLNGSRV